MSLVDEVLRAFAGGYTTAAAAPPPVDVLAEIRRLFEPTHTVLVTPEDLERVAAAAPFGVRVEASPFVQPGTAIMVDNTVTRFEPPQPGNAW